MRTYAGHRRQPSPATEDDLRAAALSGCFAKEAPSFDISALRNGAPFLELPSAFRQLHDHMLRRPGGDREMVDILALVLHHDEQAVLTAVELSLAEGVATKTHVLNLARIG